MAQIGADCLFVHNGIGTCLLLVRTPLARVSWHPLVLCGYENQGEERFSAKTHRVWLSSYLTGVSGGVRHFDLISTTELIQGKVAFVKRFKS